MEAWVERALKRWPNVPALFGWLRLDRRGRWLIQGEPITRWQIVDTINRNYGADDQGRWYFQNGPQRGYMQLDYAPFVLRAHADSLVTHTGLAVASPTAAFMDETGALQFATEHGVGALIDDELEWALSRMRIAGGEIDEHALAHALQLSTGEPTKISMEIAGKSLPISRLDYSNAPRALGYQRDPRP